jgi:hypothetical protein
MTHQLIESFCKELCGLLLTPPHQHSLDDFTALHHSLERARCMEVTVTGLGCMDDSETALSI